MNTHHIKVGSRSSRLACLQVSEIEELCLQQKIPAVFEHHKYSSAGDIDKITSLTDQRIADNFFTDQLDQALVSGEIDLAIHSAKDLPKKLDPKLAVYALTKSADETDAFVGKENFFHLPQGARVGTSSAVRQQEIAELRPDLELIDVRGTIEERIDLVDEGFADGVIIATIALKRLGLESRISNIMPWAAAPLQGQLAIVGLKSRTDLKELFKPLDVRQHYGHVTLVGAGPGDPELITVKAINALKKADIVFYDYVVSPELLKYCPKAKHVYVGKRKGHHSIAQNELNLQLKKYAQQGLHVVRLKGGDPLIFGRGADEIQSMHDHHISVSVIPGVSSATSIAANIGMPLTARGYSSSVAFVSGHIGCEKADDPKPVNIPNADTLVFLMGATKLELISTTLMEKGWEPQTPMLIISRGTTREEKIIDSDLKQMSTQAKHLHIDQPALIIVGKSIEFWRDHFKQEKVTLYTGTDPEQYDFLDPLIHFPMINITKAKKTEREIEHMTSLLGDFTHILFTSKFGVRYFFEILNDAQYDTTRLKNKTFITIGDVTEQALNSAGFSSTIKAQVPTSEGLVDTLTQMENVSDMAILFPRSALPNPTLKDQLTRIGAQVCEWTVYENHKPQHKELPISAIDQIVFTSPSTVRNFLDQYERIPENWRIISKGPLTEKSLRQAGYQSEVLIND